MRRAGPTEVESVEAVEHADHPAEIENGVLFGVNTEGAPFYYDSETEEVIERNAAGEEHSEERTSVAPDALTDFIEEVEEAVGWDVVGHDSGGSDDGDG
ncbi:hypothetical protein [Halobaculum sp. D14]|uniref:hypothetical protein n=1 Tax=unclassified Halobaculum TaxID=2640896 RepID=UPI003EBE280B